MGAGWVLCNMLPFFYLLKVLGLFRVNPEDETLGLDESYHGGSAYPGLSEDSSFHPEKGGASGPLHTHKTDNGFQHPPHKVSNLLSGKSPFFLQALLAAAACC